MNYYEMALDRLKFLERNLNSGFYTHLSPVTQQVAENILKSILESDDSNTLISHDLWFINRKLLDEGKNLDLPKKDLVNLSYAYQTGDYSLVTREEFIEYLEIMYDITDAVNLYRKDKGMHYVQKVSKCIYPSGIDTDRVIQQYRKRFGFLDDNDWNRQLNKLIRIFRTSIISDVASEIKKKYLYD